MTGRRRTNGHGTSQQEQFEQRLNGQQLSQMSGGRSDDRHAGLTRDEYLDKLTQTDLDDQTVELLDNLVTPDFVLSKITKAEKLEMKWLIRAHAEKIKAMHPDQDSPLQGDHREAMYGDAEDGLETLADNQKALVDQAVWALFMRVFRSEGGWQQQELSSQYNVSRVDDEREDDDGSRLGSLFNR
jgi:hypothetical protein